MQYECTKIKCDFCGKEEDKDDIEKYNGVVYDGWIYMGVHNDKIYIGGKAVLIKNMDFCSLKCLKNKVNDIGRYSSDKEEVSEDFLKDTVKYLLSIIYHEDSADDIPDYRIRETVNQVALHRKFKDRDE